MEKNERELVGDQLINYMTHNGIMQEVNRTFFHPIGLDLRMDEDGNFKVFKTSDKEGYLMDRINQMHTSAYRQLAMKKNSMRTRLLGFGIQVKDVFRKDAMKKIAPMFIKPEKQKLTMLLDCFQIFAHAIYSKILAKHKECDMEMSLQQFDIFKLEERLRNNLENGDWVDVAALAMMIHQNDLIIKGMKEVQVKARDYESKMKQIQEERNNFSMDELENK